MSGECNCAKFDVVDVLLVARLVLVDNVLTLVAYRQVAVFVLHTRPVVDVSTIEHNLAELFAIQRDNAIQDATHAFHPIEKAYLKLFRVYHGKGSP